MQINQRRHDLAKQVFLDTSWRLDDAVDAALRGVVEQTTPSHSLASRKFSLLKLIKNEIDPVVIDWLQRSRYVASWQFSDLVMADNGIAYATLQDLARQDRSDGYLREAFQRTCDRLIQFLDFCDEHPSNYCKTVKLEPKDGKTFDECNEETGRGTKLGARAKANEVPVPSFLASQYRILNKSGLCVACGEPTQSEEERTKWINVAFHKTTKDHLKQRTQFFTKNRGSLEYCHEHAKNVSGGSADRRARTWRGRFLSLLRAMGRKEVYPELNAFLTPADEFDFARLAIRTKKCHVNLRAIEKNLPLLLSGEGNETKHAQAVIVANIRSIFFEKLQCPPKPFDATAALESVTVGFRGSVRILDATAFEIHPIRVVPAERV